MRLQYPQPETSYLRVAYKKETSETKALEDLQAKIIELQSQLASQQITAAGQAPFMQVIHGHKFDNDFLF